MTNRKNTISIYFAFHMLWLTYFRVLKSVENFIRPNLGVLPVPTHPNDVNNPFLPPTQPTTAQLSISRRH